MLTLMDISAEDRLVYDNIIAKFDEFFIKVHHNITFEQASFNCRNQLEGESAEQYIAALYNLAELCDFNTLKDEMIQDRLVVDLKFVRGPSDGPSPNFREGQESHLSKEAVCEHQELPKHDDKPNGIDVVISKTPKTSRPRQRQEGYL